MTTCRLLTFNYGWDTLKPPAEYCFTSRVIHVEKGRPPEGKVGVGVNFYSYVRVRKLKKRHTESK